MGRELRKQLGETLLRALVQDQPARARRLLDEPGQRGARDRLAQLRPASPSGLLGRRSQGGLPLGQLLGLALGAQLGDRALGLPRDDGLDAELGAGLDGLQITVALGQGLHEDQLGAARRLLNGVLDAQLDPVAGGAHDAAGDPQPAAVDELEPLAGAQAPHGGGVAGLRAAEHDLLPRAGAEHLGLGEEDGQRGHVRRLTDPRSGRAAARRTRRRPRAPACGSRRFRCAAPRRAGRPAG